MEAGLNVIEIYDDNITLSEQEAISDMSTAIEPFISLRQSGYSTSWGITGSVKQQVFSKFEEFNGLSEYLNFDCTLEASKFDTFRINNYFSHTYEPEAFPDSFGRPQGRIGYYHNALETGYQREIDQQSEVTCGYEYTFDSADREDLSDASLHTLRVAREKKFSSTLAASANYACNYRTYSSGNEIWGNRLVLGGRRYITEQLLFAAQAGIDAMRDFEKKNYVEPTFTCSLIDDVSDRVNAQLSFSQGLTTNPFEEDVFDRWELSGSLSHDIFKRWTWSLETFYGEGTYRILNTTEELWGAELNLYFLVAKETRLNMAYRYTRIESFESAASATGYDRNIVSCSLHTRF